MKKYYIPVLALGACLVFSSCESELDITQNGRVNTADFYKNDADCEKSLAAAYESFLINTYGRTTLSGGPGIYTPAKVLANHPGDDVNYGGGNYGDHEFGGSVDEFRFNHTPEAIDWHYKGIYLSVKECNVVLEKYAANPTDFMKQAMAEARVLRAYDFFLLAQYWGQPPLVDHILEADALPSNSEMTQEQYYEWVAKECETSLEFLTERKDVNDKDGAVRVTKGFANALAGKAYLFAKKYDKAAEAFKKVIDSNKYALVPTEEYANIFHIEGDCSSEKVFELNLEYAQASDAWSFGGGVGYMQHSTWMEANCFNWRAGNFAINPAGNYCGIDGWGSIGIPEWYGNAFYENDGNSPRLKATLMHIDDAVYQTSGVKGMEYTAQSFTDANKDSLDKKAKAGWGDLFKYAEASQSADKEGKVTYKYSLNLNAVPAEDLAKSTIVGIKDVSQGLYGQSFWLPFKNIIRASDCGASGATHGNNLRLNNIIVMRYAEVLLDYAECLLQAGKAGDAKTYVNMIQKRAGSKTISDNVDMEVLKKEKSFELWFEGCRFQDILRWNDAEGIARLEKAGSAVPHLFDKLFRAPKSTDENIVWENGSEANSRFYIVHTHEAKDKGFQVGFVKGKHELFPYPSTVLGQNPNLKQNPGY